MSEDEYISVHVYCQDVVQVTDDMCWSKRKLPASIKDKLKISKKFVAVEVQSSRGILIAYPSDYIVKIYEDLFVISKDVFAKNFMKIEK